MTMINETEPELLEGEPYTAGTHPLLGDVLNVVLNLTISRHALNIVMYDFNPTHSHAVGLARLLAAASITPALAIINAQLGPDAGPDGEGGPAIQGLRALALPETTSLLAKGEAQAAISESVAGLLQLLQAIIRTERT